ncbi:hypothetical protein AB4O87_24765 [Escherichia coli]
MVGDLGELYLSGLPEKGQVMLSWGKMPPLHAPSIIHFQYQKVKAA